MTQNTLKTEAVRVPYLDFVMPDLELVSGSSLLLLGPSGCGKTTLLNLLAGFQSLSAGDVFFNGQSYRMLGSKKVDILRAQYIGFVFQRVHLIGHLSAFENVALGFSAAGQSVNTARINELFEDLGLQDKKNAKAHTLSHGQAQRVDMIRALAKNPAFIFADEPTSALDDVNAKRVIEVLKKQSALCGAGLIVSTHDARIKPYFKTVREIG